MMKNKQNAREIAVTLMDGCDRNIQPLVDALVQMGFLYLLNLVSKKEHRTINPYVIVYEFELID